MEQFNRKQKPYVKCITKEEYNTNKDKLKDKEIINIDNKQKNPITKTGGLYCLVKNNNFVHICKVNTIHSDNTSIELQPLIEINWEQWINFGGQRKVTKKGNLQNYKEFVEEIYSILHQTNGNERVALEVPEVPEVTEVTEVTADIEDTADTATEVTDTEVTDTEVTDTEVTDTEVTDTEVTDTAATEVTDTEVNKQLFEEMKEELVKANKNIETLTNKIVVLTSTIQKTNKETNKEEEHNYPLRNIVMLFMPLIITGIYNYKISL